MKKLAKNGASLMALLFLFASCSQEPLATDTQQVNQNQYQIDLTLSLQTDWRMANQILVFINQHRDSLGLPPMVVDRQHASAYAVEHTNHMISVNSMNHDHFDVRSNGLKSRGATLVGENVAKGYRTAHEVFSAWLNSASHKQVMEGNYTHVGFGVLPDDNGVYFFTMLVHN